jgi:hypothetical protein
MSYASWRKFRGNYTRGRLVVSEDPITPAEAIWPDPSLSTLFYDYEDDRYEIVAVKGTILTLYTATSGISGVDVPTLKVCSSGTVPFAVARTDLYRPFDYGDSQIGSFIRRGYIEIPFIPEVICPTTQTASGYSTASQTGTLQVGDWLCSDNYGRFVKMDETCSGQLWKKVGEVVRIDKFGSTYDTGLLEWMKWPTREFNTSGGLHYLNEDQPWQATTGYSAGVEGDTTSAYANTADGKGIRTNLNVKGAQGSVRIWLTM